MINRIESELILLNIAEKGLQTRTNLLKEGDGFVGSADLSLKDKNQFAAHENKRSILCLHELKKEHLSNEKMPRALFDMPNALCGGNIGVAAFSIFTERAWPIEFSSPEEIQKEFSNRLHQSVYFILKPQRDSGCSKEIREGFFSKEVVFNELMLTTNVAPDQILAVLCPIGLFDTVKKLFSDAQIYPIEQQISIDISNSEFEIMMHGYKKLLGSQKMLLTAPDYVSALEKFISQNNIYHFLGHAVRLPTDIDIKVVSQNKSKPLAKLIQQAVQITADRNKHNIYYIPAKFSVYAKENGYEVKPGFDNYIGIMCLSECLNKSIREKLQIDRVAFSTKLKTKDSLLHNQKIAIIEKLIPTATIEQDPLNQFSNIRKKYLITFPTMNKLWIKDFNRNLINQIINAKNVQEIEKIKNDTLVITAAITIQKTFRGFVSRNKSIKDFQQQYRISLQKQQKLSEELAKEKEYQGRITRALNRLSIKI